MCRESIVQVLVLYTFLLGIFKVCFISDGWSVTWDFIDSFCVNGIFLLDMILSFFTPYWEGQTFVIEIPKISCNYLKCYFWIDLLSVFPFDMFFD